MLTSVAMKRLHPARRAILRLADAEGATQQLAMELIAQPPSRRDRLIRRLSELYCDGMVRSGPSPDTACHLGALLEARLRD